MSSSSSYSDDESSSSSSSDDGSPGRREAMLERKASFAVLWGDQQLADVTIKIKIKGAAVEAAPPQPLLGEQEEKEGEHEWKEGEEGPAAKRARTEAGGGGEQQDTGVVATLRVHGLVLVQRSKYFQGLLLGGGAGMADGQSKTLTVEVEDEQEAADFQRLIKLSYMPSYTEESGCPLSKKDLMRLLVLTNGYERVWCVEECARALQPLENYGGATAYFATVPDSLLQTETLQDVTMEAGETPAMALGPVEQLWRPAHEDSDYLADVHLLDKRVSALPVGGIEALLRSEELQLKSENYAFSLALWWIKEQEGSDDERQPLFNRLLKSLRFARMSATFLAAIADDLWVKDSGLLPSIVARAV